VAILDAEQVQKLQAVAGGSPRSCTDSSGVSADLSLSDSNGHRIR